MKAFYTIISSIENFEKSVENITEELKDFKDIDTVYVDVYSKGNESRKQFIPMLYECARGKIDGVVISLDSFHILAYEHLKMRVQELQKHGIEVTVLEGNEENKPIEDLIDSAYEKEMFKTDLLLYLIRHRSVENICYFNKAENKLIFDHKSDEYAEKPFIPEKLTLKTLTEIIKDNDNSNFSVSLNNSNRCFTLDKAEILFYCKLFEA